jgi:hypothetical protein
VANDIKVDKAGNIIVAGGSLVGNSNFALTIKYNSNGDTLWTRYFNNGQDYGIVNKIAIDDSNNIYISGNVSIPGNCLILKYNSMGTMQWFTTFANNPPHSNGGRGISFDIFRNLYVIGTESVPFSGLNDYLLKINNEGTILWNKIFTGIVSGQGRNTGTPKGPVISSDGSCIYYSTMSANGMGGGSYSIATIKYNSMGDSHWVKVYNGGNIPGANFLGSIKLDRSNNIYVCGSGYFSVTGDDFATIKYTAAGVQQWVATYSGLVVNGGDHAQDLFIDTNFNVFVTGDAEGVSNPGVAVTIKYSQPIGIISNNNQIPGGFFIYQNHPNPFNPVTTIEYNLPKNCKVAIKVYDILGKLVEELVNEYKEAGVNNVKFNGSNLTSGIYFYKIEAGTFTDTKKMVLIK